ncbi:hypothetical protein PsYK624_066130 [Phanerochaete sordida]|uniref:Uncharacterized protein n=1 Tax=Phanerochaete sordida TaxID=48140 RepID=A0A9P3LCG3_9APHY|nr:hypothetical protein PsYK624_066130 [Phanerochaete sordida]
MPPLAGPTRHSPGCRLCVMLVPRKCWLPGDLALLDASRPCLARVGQNGPLIESILSDVCVVTRQPLRLAR